MAHGIAAATLAYRLSIDAGDAAHRGEVDGAPVVDRRPEDCALVPAIVGDELQRMPGERRVVGTSIVGELERRHYRADRLSDPLAREGLVGGRQIFADLHCDLELDDETNVIGGAHARWRAMQRRLEHHAGLRLLDADEAAHLRARQRELVARDAAELHGAQRDVRVLDGVRFGDRARRELGRQRREAAAPLVRVKEVLCCLGEHGRMRGTDACSCRTLRKAAAGRRRCSAR